MIFSARAEQFSVRRCRATRNVSVLNNSGFHLRWVSFGYDEKKRKLKVLVFKRCIGLKIPWVGMKKIERSDFLSKEVSAQRQRRTLWANLGKEIWKKAKSSVAPPSDEPWEGDWVFFFFHLSDAASAQPHRLLHASLAVVVSPVRDPGQPLHRAGGAILSLPGTAHVHRSRPLADPLPGEMLPGLLPKGHVFIWDGAGDVQRV